MAGLYNVGTQNGESVYSFTSMDTAVVNAVALAAKLGGEHFTIETQWTLNGRIFAAAMIILVVILCVLFYRNVVKGRAPINVRNVGM
jgi:hypothetical protein